MIANRLSELKSAANGIDPNIARIFIPWAIRHPRYLRTFIRFIGSHKEAKKRRELELSNGIKVPPFLILSITSQCNLACAGCYAAAAGTLNNNKARRLSKAKWRKIIEESCELGVFGFVIAGGEPFMFPGLLEMCSEFKDRLFIIVTNGTALSENDCKSLRGMSNVVILVSIEGDEKITDSRRGEGVYRKVMRNMQKICSSGALAGLSVTISRSNYRYWMDESNLDRFISMGIKVSVFIEYIPTAPGKQDNSLILSGKERESFRKCVLGYRENKPVYIIHSPGDEECFGGCVSAGRGFAHVTPKGDLTACPVSGVATHNLAKSSLKDGLKSPLFREIRASENLLETEGIPCALFAHPEEMKKLAKRVGAYKTG